MEGKHDIVAPIFKTKNSVVNKEEFIPRPAALNCFSSDIITKVY